MKVAPTDAIVRPVERRYTIRRNLQQALHCVQEALSVVEHKEGGWQATQDLEQAKVLIDEAMRRLADTGGELPRPEPTPMPGPGR